MSRPDSRPDVWLEEEGDEGDEDDEEEADAVLDEEEGEVVSVGEVDLGHVHVHRVRHHEGQREARDDAPPGSLLSTESDIYSYWARNLYLQWVA